MTRLLSISASTVALIFASMVPAQAGDQQGISYQDKKQGNVHFEKSKTGKKKADDKSVEDIEPAAGMQEDADQSGMNDRNPNKLSEEMKLPRKN